MQSYEEFIENSKSMLNAMSKATEEYQQLSKDIAMLQCNKDAILDELEDVRKSLKECQDETSETMKNVQAREDNARALKNAADELIKANTELKQRLNADMEDLVAQKQQFAKDRADLLAAQAEWNVSNRDLSKLEDRKSSLLGEIKDLEAETKRLNDGRDAFLSEIKAKQDEADILKASLLKKTEQCDKALEVLKKQKTELDTKDIELADKAEQIMLKNAKANQTLENAKALLSEADTRLSKAEAKESVLAIRDGELNGREHDVAQREKFAATRETIANDLWHGAKALEEQLNAMQSSQSEIAKAQEAKDAELNQKEASLTALGKELEEKSKNLQYLEIRLNKTIKDMQLEKILNGEV